MSIKLLHVEGATFTIQLSLDESAVSAFLHQALTIRP